MSSSLDTSINEPFYQWSVRAFSVLHKRVGMKISIHAGDDVMNNGQIFLFNHFARFETLIPQYFIYKATTAYCRCVAAHQLFDSSERFAKVLWGVGAVPDDHPGLLAFLAAEILRGQKVIIFPEGAMMKDRSITAPPHAKFLENFKTRSGHKQGAAALAVILELFKKRILSVAEEGDRARLDRWVAALGLANRDALMSAAKKPTLVVPSNITFHPIHRGENVLLKAADFLKFNLGQRGREELMVEGNLILRETDMDIRFGEPVHPDIAWTAPDRMMLARAFEEIDSLSDLFGLKDKADHWVDKLAVSSMKRATQRLRDHCMVEMYANVTLNVSHLAARLLMQFASRGETTFEQAKFHALLYAVIKSVQKEHSLHLHNTLTDPNVYGALPYESCAPLEKFYATASEAGLIEVVEEKITVLPALLSESAGDPRLANMVRVYANEIGSLTNVLRIVENSKPLSGQLLAEALFDDELRSYQIDSALELTGAELNEIKKWDGKPFLLMPEKATRAGVVLVHGFLASPAELRSFGERLKAAGHPVIGVRLEGHGTSPEDLRSRGHHEWLASVKRGYDIMAQLSKEVLVVGFATGASLALLHAAERPSQLALVVSVSAPIKFRVQNLRYAPLLHRINQLSQWVFVRKGIKPFQDSEPEHPDFEYRNMPVQALMELRKVAGLLEQRLPDVTCPVMIVHGSGDPMVDPASARIIDERLGSADKSLHIIQSDRHGVLHDNADGVQNLIISRLTEFVLPQVEAMPAPMRLVPRVGAISALLSIFRRRRAGADHRQ